MPTGAEQAALRRNVLGSVEDYGRLAYLGQLAEDFPEFRALGPEFSTEDRGAVFFGAMLNEFFTVSSDRSAFIEVLSKVNRYVDLENDRGGRAWNLVREQLLDIGHRRGWSGTAETMWDTWTPQQQGQFSALIERDTKAKQGGCYVATAVYGTYDCPELWVLRRYRDEALAASRLGRALTAVYYATSPVAVRYGGALLRTVVRRPLDGFVRFLRAQGFSDSPYAGS